MTIELTKNQYISLLKIMFLGEWVANSFRDMPLNEYESIEQYMMSYSTQFNIPDMIIYDRKLGEWFPTIEMEEEMHA